MKIGAWYKVDRVPGLSISGSADLYAFKVTKNIPKTWLTHGEFSAIGIYVWRAAGIICNPQSPDNGKMTSTICFYEAEVYYRPTLWESVEVTDRAELVALEKKLADMRNKKKQQEAEDKIQWQKRDLENAAEINKALGLNVKGLQTTTFTSVA